MPTTPAERKALMFLGIVAALGIGVRAVARVRGEQGAVGAMQPALERQLAKAEIAAREARAERERRERDKAAGKGRGAKSRGAKGRKAPAAAAAPVAPVVPDVVDVDTADSLALATLPGVGPALARRIVEDRQRRGAFGGLAALDQVPGVGPRLLERLAPRVTFSGAPRPPVEQPRARGRESSSAARGRRAGGRP